MKKFKVKKNNNPKNMNKKIKIINSIKIVIVYLKFQTLKINLLFM